MLGVQPSIQYYISISDLLVENDFSLLPLPLLWLHPGFNKLVFIYNNQGATMPQARKRKSFDKNQHSQNHQITINIIISTINNEPFPERHLLPDLFSKPVWIRFLSSLFLLFLLLHLHTRQHGIHERRWSRVNDEQN